MKEDRVTVVLFFDDPKIDMMGEKLKIEVRLKNYDCQLPFINFASSKFVRFNARQQ